MNIWSVVLDLLGFCIAGILAFFALMIIVTIGAFIVVYGAAAIASIKNKITYWKQRRMLKKMCKITPNEVAKMEEKHD